MQDVNYINVQPVEEHIKHGLLLEQWVCTLVELSANIRNPHSGTGCVDGKGKRAGSLLLPLQSFLTPFNPSALPARIKRFVLPEMFSSSDKRAPYGGNQPQTSQYQATFMHRINSWSKIMLWPLNPTGFVHVCTLPLDLSEN